MANTYLSRTLGTATNRKKCTFSHWVKISDNSQQGWFGTYNSGTNFRWGILSNGQIDAYEHDGGSTYYWRRNTNRLFRDVNAWYHLMLVFDTTQSTASDRVKIYVNGVQETSFANSVDPSLNLDLPYVNTAITHYIGKHATEYTNGYMSHVHFCDGQSYAPTVFGETDSNGVWKIKTSPSVTYGNNGFLILKDGNTITDQSSNSNNFTLGGGTLTNDKDNPSNVFATMNPLDNYYFGGTFTNGNNTVASVSSVECYWTSTLGASSGKYYWEVKIDSSGSGKDMVGIADKVSTASDFTPYSGNTKVRSYYGSNGYSQQGGTGTAFGATFGTGDIISVAMDLDNNKLYFGKNGTWQGSGNPTTGANGLAIDTSPASGFYYAQAANIHNTASTFSTNFGNGYFGTTAVSSAGTNASENGVFEYDVPTGYTALCTKGLNGE